MKFDNIIDIVKEEIIELYGTEAGVYLEDIKEMLKEFLISQKLDLYNEDSDEVDDDCSSVLIEYLLNQIGTMYSDNEHCKQDKTKKIGLPKDMLDLIETLIGDGELEQEEIDYLKEKATEYGESPIEVVSLAKTMLKKQLDEKKSEELNYQRQIEAEERKYQRKESFEGEVKKCPHCGAVINGLSKTCTSCGNMTSIDNIEKLIAEFEEAIVLANANLTPSTADIFTNKSEKTYEAAIQFAENQISKIQRQCSGRQEIEEWVRNAKKTIKEVRFKKRKPTFIVFFALASLVFLAFLIVTITMSFADKERQKEQEQEQIEHERQVELLQLENANKNNE